MYAFRVETKFLSNIDSHYGSTNCILTQKLISAFVDELQIESAELSDSGVYQCMVRTDLGEDTSYVKLNVMKKRTTTTTTTTTSTTTTTAPATTTVLTRSEF